MTLVPRTTDIFSTDHFRTFEQVLLVRCLAIAIGVCTCGVWCLRITSLGLDALMTHARSRNTEYDQSRDHFFFYFAFIRTSPFFALMRMTKSELIQNTARCERSR